MSGTISSRCLKVALILLTVLGAAIAQRLSDVQTTRFIVQTLPGARVYLDNVSRGNADREGNLVIDRTEPGDHVLKVEFPGKQPFTMTVRVLANRTTRFRADLLDYTGDLEVYTTPQAEVALDRKFVGVADASGRLLVRELAAPQEYRLHCARTGFNPAEREFRLTRGILNTITLDLKPIEVSIEATATPPPRFQQERTLGLKTNSIGQLIDPGDVLFTADGRLVGWGSKDIAVWEPGTGRQVRNVSIRPGLDLLRVSHDMNWCAVRDQVDREGQQEAKFFTLLVDINAGNVVQRHPGYYTMAFTPDSKRIVIRDPDDRVATLYEVKSGKKLQSWKEYDINHFSFSPDGRLLASSGEDGVTIRDTETGRTLQNWAGERIMALRFSHDGRWLAVLGSRIFRATKDDAGTIEFWEPATGKRGPIIETREIAQDGVFTSDSRRIVTVTGKSVQIWNIATGHKDDEWPLKDARRIALSQDNAWMAVIGEHLTLWRRQ